MAAPGIDVSALLTEGGKFLVVALLGWAGIRIRRLSRWAGRWLGYFRSLPNVIATDKRQAETEARSRAALEELDSAVADLRRMRKAWPLVWRGAKAGADCKRRELHSLGMPHEEFDELTDALEEAGYPSREAVPQNRKRRRNATLSTLTREETEALRELLRNPEPPREDPSE
jgi:hypothetical protein